MNLIELFSNSEVAEISLIIHCLLDRVPILISSENSEKIIEIMNSLSSLISFRNIMIYYDDFIDKLDYENILDNEDYDIEIQRNIFLCYPNTLEKLLQNFKFFQSWIIGCEISINSHSNYDRILNKLYHSQNFYLKINLNQDSLITHLEGKIFPDFELNFEKWLYQNAITNTEIAIEKMKRVISKRIKLNKINNEKFDNIMNFSYEESDIKENLIKKEINNFYNACKRSFNILNRLKTLRDFGLHTKISSRTLFTTIAYNHSSIDRILKFINMEWNVLFSNILNKKKSSNFSDTFEGLWG